MARRGDSELAYSTNPSENKANSTSKSKDATHSSQGIHQGASSKDIRAKMRLESKGRGGKQVTVLFELSIGEPLARDLLSSLQNLLGTGGTFKDGNIEIRGDVRNRVAEYFAKQGWKLTRAGG